MIDGVDELVALCLWYVIAVSGIIANACATILLMKKKRKKAPDLLIIHLCISEFLLVAWHLGSRTLVWFGGVPKASMIQKIGSQLTTSLFYQSLICISLDRLLAVRLSYRYRIVVTNEKFKVVVIVIWLVSILTSVVCGFISYNNTLIWGIWSAITMLSIVVTYVYIIYALNRQRRKFNGDSSRICPKFNYRIPVWIATSFFLFLFIPDTVLWIDESLFSFWFLVMWYTNYLLDPIVYVFFEKCQKKNRHVEMRQPSINSEASCAVTITSTL